MVKTKKLRLPLSAAFGLCFGLMLVYCSYKYIICICIYIFLQLLKEWVYFPNDKN